MHPPRTPSPTAIALLAAAALAMGVLFAVSLESAITYVPPPPPLKVRALQAAIGGLLTAAAFFVIGYVYLRICLAMHARKRHFGQRCERCGYDLRGLGREAPCPECGRGPS